MGQYYRPCLLNKNYKKNKQKVVDQALDCYFYDNGAKLMEHSWVSNCFVAAAMLMLLNNKENPFVWCGDYADPIKGREDGKTAYDFAVANDFDTECSEALGKVEWEDAKTMDWYILNHSKKEWVKVPKYNNREWRVHPLPLLTADGCFKGCGDYYKNNPDADKVGIWAYDVIEVVKTKKDVPKYYAKLEVHFKEDI